MRLPDAIPATRIAALGAYRPARTMDNDEAGAGVGVGDEWIRRRVGIVTRRLAAAGETIADMACVAGGKALAAGGLAPGDVDLVIVTTCTPESPIPGAAAEVASRLGIPAPGAFDLNAACAGFCYALAMASDAIRAGSAARALVISTERMSSWLDWTDRSTCVLFADGAGAAVVAPAVSPGDEPGIGPVVWGSDGSQADLIKISNRSASLGQDGQAVFRWATTSMHTVALAACERAGIDPADLAAFIPHQANLRVIEAIADRLGAPRARLATDVISTGNTSSASIPLALSAMVERGEIRSGEPALLLGFGAGVCYAAQVVSAP